MKLKKNAVILFQGDSITDVGRSRDDLTDLGKGYPKYIAEALKKDYPDVTFINRGISGNRAIDLVDRWQEDAIDLKPDVVSIMIGINDTWRRYDSANDPTSAEKYEENYRSILEQTKKTGAKIIIIEPYVLNSLPDRAEWRIDLDPKIHVARKLAQEFADIYIPLDGLMAAESLYTPMVQLSEDGVHPTETGHKFIAKIWVDTFNKTEE